MSCGATVKQVGLVLVESIASKAISLVMGTGAYAKTLELFCLC